MAGRNQDAAGPIRPVDDAARAVARRLLTTSRFGALATIHPDDRVPYASRILVASLRGIGLVTLISDLAVHARALRADPHCSVMLGEPPAKGDPLAFARMTIGARATFLPGSHSLAEAFLAIRAKARLYADFDDFHFVAFAPVWADLNAGFGRAYRLTPDDLGQT